MRFEWDENKDAINQEKHGFSFDAASLIFQDPHCLIYRDRIDEETGEQRWHAIGTADEIPAVLLVVHVYREHLNEEEIIRIISAREADHQDIRRYQAQRLD